MVDLNEMGRRFLKENFPDMWEQFNSLSSTFGELVFAKRIEMNLTQEELAENIGFIPNIIHRIEGGTPCNLNDYQIIFKFLNISNREVAEMILSNLE